MLLQSTCRRPRICEDASNPRETAKTYMTIAKIMLLTLRVIVSIFKQDVLKVWTVLKYNSVTKSDQNKVFLMDTLSIA